VTRALTEASAAPLRSVQGQKLTWACSDGSSVCPQQRTLKPHQMAGPRRMMKDKWPRAKALRRLKTLWAFRIDTEFFAYEGGPPVRTFITPEI
jgi:hypothetical protein